MFKWKRIGLVVVIMLILVVGLNQVCFSQEEGKAPEKKEKGMTLWQTCVAGGWTMIFIGLCSVLGLWLTIESLVKWQPKKIIPDAFVNWAYGAFQQKQYNEVQEYCKGNPGIISNMIGAMLEKRDEGIEKIQQAIADSGAKEEAGLHRRVSYLSTIATISPMLGLLGTVLGMIQAFNVIAFEAGLGKPTLLAAGVSKALITTAAGLIVAIPVMTFYFYFRTHIQMLMDKIEDVMTNLIKILSGETIIPAEAIQESPAGQVSATQSGRTASEGKSAPSGGAAKQD